MEEVDPAVGLPWWIYVGIAVHVLIAIVFITSLLYYHYKANTLAVQVEHSGFYLRNTILVVVFLAVKL